MTSSPMTAAQPQLVIPAELKPADGRFGCGPSKVRPQALSRLAGAGAAVMGTSHRQQPVRGARGRDPQRPARAVRRARGVRGGARQRRGDRVLGRRRVRADRAPLAAPDLRRVLREVRAGDARGSVPGGPRGARGRARRRARPGAGGPSRRAGRGRRRGVGAQRDLDRRDGPGTPARRGTRCAGADRCDLRRRRPAGGHRAGRRLLLRTAEELRGRRRAVGRAAEPRRAGADRGDRGCRPRHRRGRGRPAGVRCAALDPAVALAADRARELAEGPDLQHARRRDPVPAGRPDPLDARRRRPRLVRVAHAGLCGAPVRLGRAQPLHHPVRARPRQAVRWSSARSTSTTPWTRRRSPGRCARTGSWTPSPTASWGATSCGSGCSPPSIPPTCRRSPPASTGSWKGSDDERAGAPARAGQGEDRRLRRGAAARALRRRPRPRLDRRAAGAAHR